MRGEVTIQASQKKSCPLYAFSGDPARGNNAAEITCKQTAAEWSTLVMCIIDIQNPMKIAISWD